MAYDSYTTTRTGVVWNDDVWNNAGAVVGPQDGDVRAGSDGRIDVFTGGTWTPLRPSTAQQPFPVPPPPQWRQAPIQQISAPPITVQRVPQEAFFRNMLDPCALAGHKHSLAVDEHTGAVTVTHEDPTAPKSSGAMEMFDDNVRDNPAVGRALLGFLERMHGEGGDIGWKRERRRIEPTHVEAAPRDTREPLSVADLMPDIG